ncbi:glycosyltransferase family 4 protein [Spiribacter salinus]|uniref:glycosyltransferase family 4 protein n=1 Tax=Spiribacter salinus TaxID=1335746 RepID=UPI001C94A0CF|nr:glycosyltransferase family 4 protein [Spiribacter salinus]MBY5267721.1 glycosyltransferase WbuB [Spiribacter salinus]
MHILFLTDNFPPEVNAPASRTFEHCREWVRQGHKVTVVTTAPNFPKGEVFDGYRNRLWQWETVEGIRVLRVWTYITANAGFLKRTLDYLSFMVTGFLAGLFVRRIDVVIGTSPQFFTNCAAWLLSIIRRRPFVFELRDLWPESIKTVGAMEDNWVIRLLERLELFLYRRADVVIAVTHSFRRNLIERGIDPNKIHVVTNGVDLSRFHPMARDDELVRSVGLEEAFVAGYIGTHGMAHSLETLLDAAAALQAREDDPVASRLRLVLLGDGARKAALKDKAAEMDLRNVVFLDTVPKNEVPRYWSLLDISIIHLRRDPNFTQVIPSKLFECMAMGIPVLHGVEGESAEIVEREAVGQTFEPENAGALVEGLLSLARDRAKYERYRSACLEAASKYDRRRLANDMLEVIEAVAP